MTDGSILDYTPLFIGFVIAVIFVASGIKTIRPTHRAIIERLGKYSRFKESGIVWVTPIVEKLYAVNITEQMTEVDKQEIITKDNLNASVSAQIYHKVKEDETSVKNSFYKVNNVKQQIVSLAQTTMRNVIGSKDFVDVNSKRQDLNEAIRASIAQQTSDWGIDVVRSELKEIEPPKAVQETMNNVIQAQNKKQAAVDLATAAATEADGERQAEIKRSEGERQAVINRAEGQAQSIKTVAQAQAEQIKVLAEAEAEKIKVINTAIRENFKDSAIPYRQLEVTENSLSNNTKVVFTKDGIQPIVIVGDDKTVIPVPKKSD